MRHARLAWASVLSLDVGIGYLTWIHEQPCKQRRNNASPRYGAVMEPRDRMGCCHLGDPDRLRWWSLFRRQTRHRPMATTARRGYGSRWQRLSRLARHSAPPASSTAPCTRSGTPTRACPSPRACPCSSLPAHGHVTGDARQDVRAPAPERARPGTYRARRVRLGTFRGRDRRGRSLEPCDLQVVQSGRRDSNSGPLVRSGVWRAVSGSGAKWHG
jgi:hypothetical protein